MSTGRKQLGASYGSSTASQRQERIERPGLSQDELEELEEAFKLFDTEGTGTWFCRVLAAECGMTPRLYVLDSLY